MKVERLVGKVFSIDPEKVSDSTSRESIEEWDSMGHLTLVMELEREFSINFAIDDTLEMTEVGKIKEVLKRYGVV
jgi:acyl carrier protein